MINFIRGGSPGDPKCVDADFSLASLCETWRTWAHAAVQHTSPVVVTYSATSQIVFYLSVDGLLHAVDTVTAQEKWSFLVEEAFPQLNALMTNDPGPPIQIADGSISFFHKDSTVTASSIVGGTDQVLLFFGLRRGGRAYYALDITDIDNAGIQVEDHQHADLQSGVHYDGTYAKLGQSWSKPIVARLQETSVIASGFPALVFSGGYDPNQDNRRRQSAPTPWVRRCSLSKHRTARS